MTANNGNLSSKYERPERSAACLSLYNLLPLSVLGSCWSYWSLSRSLSWIKWAGGPRFAPKILSMWYLSALFSPITALWRDVYLRIGPGYIILDPCTPDLPLLWILCLSLWSLILWRAAAALIAWANSILLFVSFNLGLYYSLDSN